MKGLPPGFEGLLQRAVDGVSTVDASDHAVRQNAHLEGFPRLVDTIVAHHRLDGAAVFTGGSINRSNPELEPGTAGVTLPGFYRRSKAWDCVVVHRPTGLLVAALELKTMNREQGKNVQNRLEELVGLGADFRAAVRAGLMSPEKKRSLRRPYKAVASALPQRDLPSPFVGYLMVLPDSIEVTGRAVQPVRAQYSTMSRFDGTSQSARVAVALAQGMHDGLFDAGAVLIRKAGQPHSHESGAMSGLEFFEALADHIALVAERLDH
ncbi:MAG: hypothetical protein H6742_19545 [Alphaproteobacteria bacterium]|nr:hypothetical protein [Alphaproteobacteria bacterium]